MIDPKIAEIDDYLQHAFPCSCGQTHTTALKRVLIGSAVLFELPSILAELNCRSPMVVCDRNTYSAVGEQVTSLLLATFPQTNLCLLDRAEVVPGEATLGEILMAHIPTNDIIVAVGSGTINDLCKYLSFHLGLPYLVVASAPSMDGFASIGAALITNHLKTTYDTHAPAAIIGDTDVLCKAPMQMITAGLGDILGKYTCLLDWKVAHIITDEYYCPTIVEMVQESIRRVTKNIKKVKTRDPQAIAAIMEALVLTGIAMSFVGNSRPASGSEHHISHYWEMKFLMEGKMPVLHGTKVGIGAVTSCYLYHLLRTIIPDFDQAKQAASTFDLSKWEKLISRTYAQAAPSVIALEKTTGKNSAPDHAARIEKIEAHWSELMTAIDTELPETNQIIDLLADIGAPISPGQVGVSSDMLVDSILVAKEVRNRYTILQLLWDLNVENSLAEQTAAWFSSLESRG